MASWILVPCLVALRGEFNDVAPARDHTSDGSIGDPAHAQESSDHNPDETGKTPYEDSDSINEVHAIDVDKDLNRPGVTMEQCVQVIVGRHRHGHDDRLQNVIYNRRIWSRSWDWAEHPYDGSNPHDHHAHFSARYSSAQEADTRPWGLIEEFDVALSDDDKKWILANIAKADIGESRTLGGSVTALMQTAPGRNPIGNILIPDYAQPADTRRNLSLSTWIGYLDATRNGQTTTILSGVQAALAADDDVANLDLDALAEKLAGPLAQRLNAAGAGADRAEITAALREVFSDAATPDKPPA